MESCDLSGWGAVQVTPSGFPASTVLACCLRGRLKLGSPVTSHHSFRAGSHASRICSVSQRSASIILSSSRLLDQFFRSQVSRSGQSTHSIGQMAHMVAPRFPQPHATENLVTSWLTALTRRGTHGRVRRVQTQARFIATPRTLLYFVKRREGSYVLQFARQRRSLYDAPHVARVG
jgi:hypothetical protein